MALEHQHVLAVPRQEPRAAQPAEPAADHDDVRLRPLQRAAPSETRHSDDEGLKFERSAGLCEVLVCRAVLTRKSRGFGPRGRRGRRSARRPPPPGSARMGTRARGDAALERRGPPDAHAVEGSGGGGIPEAAAHGRLMRRSPSGSRSSERRLRVAPALLLSRKVKPRRRDGRVGDDDEQGAAGDEVKRSE
jgi:hypothetical protein